MIFWVLGLGRKEDNKRYQWLGFKTTIVNRREVVDVVASTVMGKFLYLVYDFLDLRGFTFRGFWIFLLKNVAFG